MNVIIFPVISVLLISAPPFQAKSYKCVFPDLKPWSEEVKPFVKTPAPFNCTGAFPLLFESNLTHLIPQKFETFKKSRIRDCCYKVVIRLGSNDDAFGFGEPCFPVSLTEAMEINGSHHIIAIFCTKGESNSKFIIDMHVFPMDQISKASKQKTLDTKNGNKVNMIIVGLDSMSRMNFLRTMPRTHDFLINSLSAIELKGYNRIEQYSYANLVALITNLTSDEYSRRCYNTKNPHNCPYIWEAFSASGYVTGYGADHYTFTGFKNPPTDIHLRQFALAMEEHLSSENRFQRYPICGGPRQLLEVHLNVIKKAMEATQSSSVRRRLFYHFFLSSLAHEDPASSMNGDEVLLSFIKWLKDSSYLDNTVLLILSDHGLEYSEFRNTRQAKVEADLPMLYFVLPPSFKDRCPGAYKNIMGNRERLTTSFDIHQTLVDVSNLELLQDRRCLEWEEKILKIQAPSRRGFSLFQPVPERRTCDEAGIHHFFCSCVQKTTPVSKDDKVIQFGAQLIVKDMNRRVINDGDGPKCALLSLNRVISANRRYSRADETVEDGYIISVETVPGYGQFDGVIVFQNNQWIVDGEPSRTNPYGNQSLCVRPLRRYAVMYCFCK